MVIKHGYPLNMVQHEFFETFVKNLHPMLELHPQDILEADVHCVYKEQKEILSQYFESLFCLFSLTIELRSSDDKNVIYCCLTLHLIGDGWGLKKKILAFRKLAHNYDAKTLHEVIIGVLTEWKLNKNVAFIFVDIAPANDHMVGELKNKLFDQGTPHYGDLCYLSSFAQVLDHLVQDALDEIQCVLCKIRQSIQYVNGTNRGQQKFLEALNLLKLQDKEMACLDVPKRWDTTFLMLEGALELRNALTLLQHIEDDFKVNPSLEEWNMAAVVFECLKVLHECIALTGVDAYFLGVCGVYENLLQWGKSQNVCVRSMANRMKVEFDQYWGENFSTLGILVVLNPCFKLDLVEYGYNQMYGSDAELHLSRFRCCLKRVYNKYANESSSQAPSTSSSTDARSSASNNPNSKDRLLRFNEWQKRKYDCNAADKMKSELDQYLEQSPVMLDKDSDILAWWHTNAPNFPTLGKMARDFLAIPLSTIISKSSFDKEVAT